MGEMTGQGKMEYYDGSKYKGEFIKGSSARSRSRAKGSFVLGHVATQDPLNKPISYED